MGPSESSLLLLLLMLLLLRERRHSAGAGIESQVLLGDHMGEHSDMEIGLLIMGSCVVLGLLNLMV